MKKHHGTSLKPKGGGSDKEKCIPCILRLKIVKHSPKIDKMDAGLSARSPIFVGFSIEGLLQYDGYADMDDD